MPEKADVFCYLLLISFCILNQGAGKSAVLNSLIGHPVLVSCTLSLWLLLAYSFSYTNTDLCCVCYTYYTQPTGENGATRAPIIIELSRESSLSSKAIILQIDNKSQQVSASKSLSMNICNLAMLCEALSAFMIKKFRSVFS